MIKGYGLLGPGTGSWQMKAGDLVKHTKYYDRFGIGIVIGVYPVDGYIMVLWESGKMKACRLAWMEVNNESR